MGDPVIKVYTPGGPDEDLPYDRAEQALVEQAMKMQRVDATMTKVGELHRKFRMVGGKD